MGGADETDRGDHLRHHHQHRRLPAVPDPAWGTGEFLYSLPIVLTCSLVAALIVAMIFIPFLGYFLLKPKIEPPLAERRKNGFPAFYYRVGEWAINHRWRVLLGSLILLAGAFLVGSRLKTDFFPKDLSYLSYLDVWLPEDAPLSAPTKPRGTRRKWCAR